ncbi:hypothetical protein [Hymenobacter wooponensis]|uniref:Uncharacterized protein n=1 Tax=Hymenobacter wooponensis TaxID=1525360 RepID=A0A4Z0MNI4_9BACT|nr:hypothetical protein [Hymenobacter wooponensis]TGD80817.1 hypothetical protein EU557_13520 [Hymenobacter wooponensis]
MTPELPQDAESPIDYSNIPLHERPPIERRIAEFKDKIQVLQYNPVIEQLHYLGKGHQIELFWGERYQESRCLTTPIKGGYSYGLRIKSIPVTGDNKEIVFDILHEMGHAFDPQKLPQVFTDEERQTPEYQELVRGREIRAWQWADREFERHSELHLDRGYYRAYRNFCLCTYGIDLNRYAGAKPINF